jgi:hypothetical protein
LAFIRNQNTLATLATGLTIRQDAAAEGIRLDQNGNNSALVIDSEATNAHVISVTSAATTTGLVLSATTQNALTTGKIAHFQSNGADTTTRELVTIHNDNTLATGTTSLEVINDSTGFALKAYNNNAAGSVASLVNAGTGDGLLIDQNGNGISLSVAAASTSANVVNVGAASTTTGTVFRSINANALTTGKLFYAHSQSANTSARSLVEIINGSSLATGALALNISQSSTQAAMRITKGVSDGGFIDFSATADADTTSAISTLTTSGATTQHIQIEINGTKAWIAVSTNAPT